MGISASLSLPEVSDSLEITFDREAGFYDNPFTLVLQTDVAGYNIIYTLDGSNPQTSASVLQGGTYASITVDPEKHGRAGRNTGFHRASLIGGGWIRTVETSDKIIHFHR